MIAHEVGHHVQKLLGIEPKVRQMQQNASQAEVNRLSVRMELQADCFAGVWGHSMQQQGVLETGDLEEALNAAQAIGDDRSSRARGALCRTALPMAPQSSATAGLSVASTAATRRSVIPSAKLCDVGV